MFKATYVIGLITILMVFALGCSSGSQGINPMEPESRESILSENAHSIWGLWQFTIDPDAQSLDVVALRDAEMHVNVLPFLEPPALLNLTLEAVEFNGNIIEADIGLRHPFLGLNEFTGFDVCGIFIGQGSVSGYTDPDLVLAGDTDTQLLNPDMLTRWWNPSEFPVNNGTMFAYNDGLLGAPHEFGQFNATLNGCKYYTDGLNENDSLDTIDPSARGVFSPGQKNIRHFTILMGDQGLVFNYAIDANWQYPQGDPPYTVEDFGPYANRPEAWNITTTIVSNTLFNDGVSSGGGCRISVDVYDHFNADLNNVVIDSLGYFTHASSNAAIGGGVGYSTYEVEISNASPPETEMKILIAVESDVDGYGGVLPGSPVTSYFKATVPVGITPPITGVFVDGDNAGDPNEDGSMSHPFDVIQEGIDAAGTGDFNNIFDVYVDPYEGGNYALFTLANDVNVEGYAFNAGTGRPAVTLTNTHTFANGVSDASLKNFIVNFNHTTQTGGEITFFRCANSSNLTIEDCYFTGIGSAQYCRFFDFIVCDGLSIEHNEFDDFRNKSNMAANMYIWFFTISGCDNATIRHNEFHNIGFDDEGYNTTYNITMQYTWDFRPSGSNLSDNLTVENNLLYNIKDWSNSTASGWKYNYITVMRLYNDSQTGPNMVLANNTVDDLSEVAYAGAVGAMKFCYGYNVSTSMTIKNTILSNWNPFSGAENGHRGFWADGFNHTDVDYSNVYNIGPVGHPQVRDYVNTMHKGIGSFGIYDYENPSYDTNPGANWYHVTNSNLLSDDGSEMGAFGGTNGDWLPPSQG